MSDRLAIHKLLEGGIDNTKIRDFLRAHSFPVIEGEHATFVWYGFAHQVYLRHWVYGLETSNELTRIENTDLWHLTLEIPRESRVEYKFEVHDHLYPPSPPFSLVHTNYDTIRVIFCLFNLQIHMNE